MNKRHHIYLQKRGDGRYLVASIHEPRFCLEADSEQAARDAAARAFKFYAKAKHAVTPEKKVSVSTSPFTLDSVEVEQEAA